MITNWPFIYVYGTGRDDEWTHAVGMMPKNGPANGSVGLFTAKDDAYLFADALAKATGGTASDSPETNNG